MRSSSIGVPSSARIGLEGGIGTSTETSLVVAVVAEAMASAITSAPSKKPFKGMSTVVGASYSKIVLSAKATPAPTLASIGASLLIGW